MPFTRGFRFERHLTGHRVGVGLSAQRMDLPLALNRMSLLAGGMVLALVFEFLLLLVVQRVVPGFVPPYSEIARPLLVVALGMSGVAFTLSRLGRLSFRFRLTNCIGYVFSMVIVIAAAEVSTQWWVHDDTYVGIPWVCIWLLMVPLVVPIEWSRAVARGLVLAVLPTLVMFFGVRWFDLPPPPIDAYLAFLLPSLVVSVLALIIAKTMYALTRQVQEARQLGSYELTERIGSGGMGEVWKARHRMLVRPAAIKLIRPESLGTTGEREALVDRFQREAQATASLRSPHTVELYDFGVADDGTFFYVMELLSGMDLKELVQHFGPLDPARVIYLMRQICDSLADAHDHGLLHRDIKPANIILSRAGRQCDFIKVLDFGLVKQLHPESADAELTQHVDAIGTPSVMAPEAVRGQPLDHRADLYGLGCVGYWLLTGGQVFVADSALEMAAAHAKEEPEPPSRRTELNVPPELDGIILDCLAKDPRQRPDSAADLAERLAACSCPDAWDGKKACAWWDMHLADLKE